MKKFLIIFTLFISQMIIAQGKGVIKGQLLDKEMNNEPLSFASVFLKGTTIGTETDLDGNFMLSVDSGDYILVFDFLGYKTLEVPVFVNSGETVIVNKTLEAAEGVALEEVQLKANTSKQKEIALLMDQIKAVLVLLFEPWLHRRDQLLHLHLQLRTRVHRRFWVHQQDHLLLPTRVPPQAQDPLRLPARVHQRFRVLVELRLHLRLPARVPPQA